jgi:beta-glucosidase
MTKLVFPDTFYFGTSTSAYQIETAFGHDWMGFKARDGHIFERTTDHEKRLTEDIGIIASLAPNYRMSVMWSRLQRHAYGPLDQEATEHYHTLFRGLREKKVSVMMVLHHFTNPIWFAASGGWQNEKNIAVWCDYARKIVDEFGESVATWNTFNEPNLYVTMGFILGEFPPFKKNPGQCHNGC